MSRNFFKHIFKTPKCWEWTASLDGDGYGKTKIGKRFLQAHRASWEIHNGPIPNGLWVLHKCDNPKCVNPDHLYLGNHLQNVRDRQDRGRAACGERTGNSKLSNESVIHIRKLASDGALTHQAIADKFSVTQGTITKIVARQMWGHI